MRREKLQRPNKSKLIDFFIWKTAVMVIKRTKRSGQKVRPKAEIVIDDLTMARALSVFDKIVPLLIQTENEVAFRIAYGTWVEGKSIDFDKIGHLMPDAKKISRISNSMYSRIRDKFNWFKTKFYFELPDCISKFVFDYFSNNKYQVDRTTVIIILSKVLNDFGYANYINKYHFYSDPIMFGNGYVIAPSIGISCYLRLEGFGSDYLVDDLEDEFNNFKLLVRNFLEYSNINVMHSADCPCHNINPERNQCAQSNVKFVNPHPRERLIMQVEGIIANCNCNTGKNLLQLLYIANMHYTDSILSLHDNEIDQDLKTVQRQLSLESLIYLGNSKWIDIKSLITKIESEFAVWLDKQCF